MIIDHNLMFQNTNLITVGMPFMTRRVKFFKLSSFLQSNSYVHKTSSEAQWNSVVIFVLHNINDNKS